MAPTPGVIRSGDYTTFTVWAPSAEAGELCLFDPENIYAEAARHSLTWDSGFWSVSLSGVASGTPYGFRMHGAYAPTDGLRFNASKLLVDPYARSISGRMVWHP